MAVTEAGVRAGTAARRANLGCGSDIRPGYINVDSAALPGVDVVHDLRDMPWPFEDGALDEIVMINVLEHLPDTVKVVEEIHRVLKVGGIANIRVPYWNCWNAYADPTHRAFFHQITFDFFDPAKLHGKERPYYSHARFTVERVDYWVNWGKWLLIRNRPMKALLSVGATFLCNIIWVLEFRLRALPRRV